MAAYSELTLEQYSNFSTTINVDDASGNPINLYGYTAASQIIASDPNILTSDSNITTNEDAIPEKGVEATANPTDFNVKLNDGREVEGFWLGSQPYVTKTTNKPEVELKYLSWTIKYCISQ